jgi:hypothetical protein
MQEGPQKFHAKVEFKARVKGKDASASTSTDNYPFSLAVTGQSMAY